VGLDYRNKILNLIELVFRTSRRFLTGGGGDDYRNKMFIFITRLGFARRPDALATGELLGMSSLIIHIVSNR